MMRAASVLFVLITMLLTGSLPATAKPSRQIPTDELSPLMAEIEHRFSTVKTLKARLVQEKTIPIFAEPVVSKGICIYKSPDKLRLEFSEPFKSALLVSGRQVEKYEFMDGGWQRLNMGNQDVMLMIMDNIASWLKGQFKKPELYDIRGVEDQKITIFLTPKSPEFRKFIQSFELGLNSSMDGLDYIVIHEARESLTRIRFEHDLKNAQVSDAFFKGTADGPVPVPGW